MKPLAFLLITLVFTCAAAQQKSDRKIPAQFPTPYETSGYLETPRYDETLEFCRKLAAASPWVRIFSFGRSPEGRDLPFLVVSNSGAFDPGSAARSGKSILMIQCGIHAGEIDGKDASLMLVRDIAVTKTRAALLDHVILLIIPIFNVDGHERFGAYNRINQNGPKEMGWRVTSQNLNLNRDYMKADAPEMQAWLRLFNLWLPDFFIDCHVTDGADYQHVITYGIEDHVNAAEPVRRWLHQKYDPVLDTITTNGVPVAPYIFLRDEFDPAKGLQGGIGSPRLSTPYVALQNRAALLIETHMLKPYRARVEGTYTILLRTLEVLNREYASLKDAVRSADLSMAKGSHEPFPIQFTVSDTPVRKFHYLGFRQTNSMSDVSGAKTIAYTREPFAADIPFYDSVVVSKTVTPPFAYVIPPQWADVIARLKLHGIRVERLSRPVELTVQKYRLSNVKWQQQSYEGHHQVKYAADTMTERRLYPKGTGIVRMNQRTAGVAMNLLEPDGPDAFLSWGFFDACLEQKEYAEDYVMEPIARRMLASDSTLRVEFDAKLKSDTAFAHSPFARLNFFYQRSPYWDPAVNVYPVGRLLSQMDLPVGEPAEGMQPGPGMQHGTGHGGGH